MQILAKLFIISKINQTKIHKQTFVILYKSKSLLESK
jgi:hypothetical protein